MIINMIGGGSGGAALNFKVVPGLTQPGTASENTTWVKTEKIGAWYFSATRPEGLQEWDVWFTVGTSSAVEFSALKKNGIQVYPISAKQYVNGAEKDVYVMSYQNGKWVDWVTYLYKEGDEYTDITGGWTTKGIEFTSASKCYPAKATVTYNDGQMVITMPANYQTGVVWTSKNIDLAKIQTLTFKGYKTGKTSYGCKFVVVPENASYWSGNAIAQIDISGSNGPVNLDVSSLTGAYRVGIGICTGGPSEGAVTVYVDEIFEK